MDINKLNPRVKQISNDLMQVRVGLPLSSAVQAVNYKLASIASQLHIKVDTQSGYQPAMCSAYMLTLLPSGCVDKDTEFLSPNGWKRISEYNNEKILEVDVVNGFISNFYRPLHYIKERYTKEANRIISDSRTKMDMFITDEHRVLYYDKYIKEYKVDYAKNIINKQVSIPSHFNIGSGHNTGLTQSEIRLQVAICADATLIQESYKRNAVFRLKKQDKKDRLRMLLDGMNADYNWSEYEDGYCRVSVKAPIYTKRLSDFGYELNSIEIEFIADEIRYWDSSIDNRTGNIRFHTTIKEEADYIQFILQASNKTVVSLSARNRIGRIRVIGNKEYTTHSIDYVVSESNSLHKNIIKNKVVKEKLPDETQYCFTTNTGFWLARRNGYIFVTGNCGKNSSLGLLDRFYFKESYDKVKDLIYPHYKNKAIQRLSDEGIERDLHSWTQSISNATTSGMYAYAETFSLVGFGSLNIEVDEIGNAVTSKAELFEQLLTPYDNGDFMPVAKRTDSNSMSITGLPVNLYSFGNKVRLFNGDSTEREFIKLLDEGYGRRFIFVDDNSEPINKTPQQILEEFDKAESIRRSREKDRLEIADLVRSSNFNKVLTMDRDAMLYYATIKANSDSYVNDNKGLPPAVIADISERHFKTIKLAGIYAFFDNSSIVTAKNMEEAYEVIQESSNVLMDLRRVKPLHERLLDQLLLESKCVSVQTMLTYPFVNSGWTKKILEYIELAQQLAVDKGYEWIIDKKQGVDYYMVIDRSKTINKEIF